MDRSPTPDTASPHARLALRSYEPCDSKEAASLLGISLPAFNARRGSGTIWYEIGGGGSPVAVGSRPRNRGGDALPLVGIAPAYLGVCLPGHEWVYDRQAVLATRVAPLEVVSLLAMGSALLSDLTAQLLARLERAP